MADQIVLAWTVDVTGTPLGPAEAATALAAVELYKEAEVDPVLGALFGLTVESDVTAPAGSTATRTLTLNMTSTGPVTVPAPPTFPCHPFLDDGLVEVPEPPYRLVRTVSLGGLFLVATASAVVQTERSQMQTLVVGDTIQFFSQPGVSYEIAIVTDTTITLTAPYTGRPGNTSAFKIVPAPVTVAAIYSTSWLDTAAVAGTVPPIPAGVGAREVEFTYNDSTGATFTVEMELNGRRPVMVVLDPGSVDIAEIVSIVIDDTGGFANNVGQITLAELSAAVPSIGLEPSQADFKGKLTDEAQLLITLALAYVPPSYFALAQQGTSFPALDGDFLVTTDSDFVYTVIDQTAVLDPGDVIQFASQLVDPSPLQTREVFYTISEVGPKHLKLTTPYTGVDQNFTGNDQPGVRTQSGTKGNFGSKVQKKATAAFLINPSPAAPPSNTQLSAPLGRFLQEAVVGLPPGNASTPAPTYLSDLFTHTIQLALAGIPVTSQPVAFI